MRTKFQEYYQLTSAETKQLFLDAFIVLDTNVLLNFYRYSTGTVERFIQILTNVKDNIWLPYQVVKEFHRKRIDEIITQRSIYNDAKKEVLSLLQKFEDKHRNPFISQSNLNLFPKLVEELGNEVERFDNLLKKDIILEKIETIFDKKVGNEFNEDELSSIFKEGKERYKNKIPPGFADEKDKPEDFRKYGDLIIWKEMIDNSKKTNKPCIFITDDRKIDWWLMDKSKNIYMPLPELRREFVKLTNCLFYSYQPFSFLELVKAELQVEVEPEVIREVKELLYKYDENELTEMYFIRQKNSGDINNLEHALLNLGYQLQVIQNKHNIYKIVVFLPRITDIKRLFLQKLNELTERYDLEILEENEP